MIDFKNLTPEQCVEIAKLINNDEGWAFRKYEWDGYDIILKKTGTFEVVQLDYREVLPEKLSRLRYYEYNPDILEMEEKTISFEVIVNIVRYIDTL